MLEKVSVKQDTFHEFYKSLSLLVFCCSFPKKMKMIVKIIIGGIIHGIDHGQLIDSYSELQLIQKILVNKIKQVLS